MSILFLSQTQVLIHNRYLHIVHESGCRMERHKQYPRTYKSREVLLNRVNLLLIFFEYFLQHRDDEIKILIRTRKRRTECENIVEASHRISITSDD